MRFEKFTIKAREAIAEAQRIAGRLGNPEVRPGHLLMAMVVQEEGVVPRLCNFLGVPMDAVERETAQVVDSYSKVSGGSKAAVSRELQAALDTR